MIRETKLEMTDEAVRAIENGHPVSAVHCALLRDIVVGDWPGGAGVAYSIAGDAPFWNAILAGLDGSQEHARTCRLMLVAILTEPQDTT